MPTNESKSKKNKQYLLIGILLIIAFAWVAKEFMTRNAMPDNLVVNKVAPDFNFINQDSVMVSQKDYKNKVYVVEFHFTRCPGICKTLNRNMKKLYDKFASDPNFKLLSYTVDPTYDTPAVLKEFANKMGVSGNQWNFVTGEKKDIYSLAYKGYLVSVMEDKSAEGGFLHTEYFLLVDKKGRIISRKDQYGNPKLVYNGTNDEDIRKLSRDVKILLGQNFGR